MKHFFLLLSILLIMPAAGNSLADDVNVNVQTGIDYTWWRDSESNTGYQALVPVKISSQYKDISVSVLTGYAYSGYAAQTAELDTLSQLLDTKINFSYALMNKLPFDVLFGLDFNIPTARAKLSTSNLSLLMDPDLVPLSQLGEGFNVNPTLSVAKDWGRFITGLSVGYIWRGKYDFATNATDYDPGDIFTATAEARYDFSSAWSGRIFGQYARFTKDELNDRTLYREGDFYMGGVGLKYAPKSWDASLTVRYIYRDKSELPTGNSPGELAAMSNSIHGNETVGDLTVSYFWSEPTTLWIKIAGLYAEANGYPDSSYFYTGSRQKASLELGWKRMFGRHWETSLFVRGFTMHDDNRRYPQTTAERTYNGFSAGGAVVARF